VEGAATPTAAGRRGSSALGVAEASRQPRASRHAYAKAHGIRTISGPRSSGGFARLCEAATRLIFLGLPGCLRDLDHTPGCDSRLTWVYEGGRQSDMQQAIVIRPFRTKTVSTRDHGDVDINFDNIHEVLI